MSLRGRLPKALTTVKKIEPVLVFDDICESCLEKDKRIEELEAKLKRVEDLCDMRPHPEKIVNRDGVWLRHSLILKTLEQDTNIEAMATRHAILEELKQEKDDE